MPSPQETHRAVATQGHTGPSWSQPHSAAAPTPFLSLSWRARDLSNTALARSGLPGPCTYRLALISQTLRTYLTLLTSTVGAATHLGHPLSPHNSLQRKDVVRTQ